MGPTGVDIARVLSQLGAAAAMISVIGTWLCSALLLVLYRRRVRAGMRDGRPDGPRSWPAPPSHSGTLPIVAVGATAPSPLFSAARRRAARGRLIMALAGGIYGVSAAFVFIRLLDAASSPHRVLTFAMIYGWPVVPSLLTLSFAPRLVTMALTWTGYLAVPVTLLMLNGETLPTALGQLAVIIGLPAAVVALTSARSLRGVSWLVTPALLLVSFAVLALRWPVEYVAAGVFDRDALVLLLASIAALAILVIYGLGLVWAYRAKIIGDQLLNILQWWFVATAANVIDPSWGSGWQASLFAVPLVLFCVTLLLGWRLISPVDGPGARLLLLRTFGARRRSSRLLQHLSRQWRRVGSVELVAAADVATEVLDPDEFVDYLAGRLPHRFIDGPDALRRRLGQLDLRADADGSYRVNEFLCRSDAWKPTVEALITTASAVLIDLRGFTSQRAGAAYEIERLVNLVDLRRVIAIIDDTTDQLTLQSTLDQALAYAAPGAPVHRYGLATWQVVRLRGGLVEDPRQVMSAVFGVASQH